MPGRLESRAARLAALSGACAAALSAAPSALAAESGQSPYIKGYRDLLIGLVPPEPGVYLRNDLIYYGADVDRTVLNGQVQLELDSKALIEALSISWVTDVKIFGGQYAFGILPTLMYADVTASADTPFGRIERSDDIFSLGDLGVSPVVLGWHSGNWHWNAGLAVLIPTGSYDTTDVAHTSLNYWAFIPEAGLTYFDPASGWDASIGLAYTLPFKNEATDYQSGQILHVDASLSKAFGEVRLGGIFYAMWQLTNDHEPGAVLGAYKSQVYGVGPLVSFSAPFAGTQATFIGKWAHEFGSDNTFEGDTVTAAMILPF